MTAQLTARTVAGSRHHSAGAATVSLAGAAPAGTGTRQRTISTRAAAAPGQRPGRPRQPHREPRAPEPDPDRRP